MKHTPHKAHTFTDVCMALLFLLKGHFTNMQTLDFIGTQNE